MPRPLVVRVHVAASTGAIATITLFLFFSGLVELTGGDADVRVLRRDILLGLPVLIACLATAGLTGRELAGKSRSVAVRRKQRRLQIAATIGVLVLVPSAFILNHLSGATATGQTFTALQVVEFLFGTINLSLLVLNFRDGRRMSLRLRPVQMSRRDGSRS